MKKNIGLFAMVIAIAASFLVGRFYDRPKTLLRSTDVPALEIVSPTPYGSLVLLVDSGEVYCGKERAPKEAIEEYVSRTMELNHAKKFIVFGSDSARYGDVIALIGKLRKKGLRLAEVWLRPVPSGLRLPAIYSKSFDEDVGSIDSR